MKVGYLDCFSGLSGDMILGALLDCGLPIERLKRELRKLNLKGYKIEAKPAKRGVITGTRVTIVSKETHDKHRSLNDIIDLIDKSDVSQKAKEGSIAVFTRLAAAEAKVHHTPIDKVQFHEVGAIDAIVDVVGTAIGLELLGIEALYASPLPSGSGIAKCEHGTIPIPAPATLELIAACGAPIRPTPYRDAELVTPTGAAIVTTLASFECPTMSLQAVGYGIGSRELEGIPNVLPLWIGESIPQQNDLLLFETNIDDMSPELCGYAMERLFERGALDVWFTPIQMKKNRPAVMLSVLARPESQGAIVETILQETSTLGIRVQQVARHYAAREIVKFDSRLGKVSVKLKRLEGKVASLSPEYEDCRRIARKRGLPLREVYRIVSAEAHEKLIGR